MLEWLLDQVGPLVVYGSGGFVLGSLFPQPEKVKKYWDIVSNYVKSKF